MGACAAAGSASEPRRVTAEEAGMGVIGEAGAVGEIGFRGAPVAAVDGDEDVVDVRPDGEMRTGARWIVGSQFVGDEGAGVGGLGR